MKHRVCFVGLFIALLASVGLAHQLETPGPTTEKEWLLKLEAGDVNGAGFPLCLRALAQGRYQDALKEITPKDEATFPWLRPYLLGLIPVAPTMSSATVHFDFYTTDKDTLLSEYAPDALEKAYAKMTDVFQWKPTSRLRVEVYPDEESFSKASTLSMETLERSGAIGICKFHRLMILSPRACPLGYRWMDALAHEFNHLLINEMTAAKMELWMHEGTARYFDTAYRSDPPSYLDPRQKADLKESIAKNTFVSYDRMSPSLVYLKDQSEVSLAFAEVSYSVDHLVRSKGQKTFNRFMRRIPNESFNEAFRKAFGSDVPSFELIIRHSIANEPWESVKGAMGERVLFKNPSDETFIGADAMAKMHMAERMRRLKRTEAALYELEGALQLEPDNGVILYKAAIVSRDLGQTEKAVAYLKKAIDKNPNYVSPYLMLGEASPPKEAVLYFSESNAMNPYNPALHQAWAKAAETLGDKKTATRERRISQILDKFLE